MVKIENAPTSGTPLQNQAENGNNLRLETVDAYRTSDDPSKLYAPTVWGSKIQVKESGEASNGIRIIALTI